MANKITVSVEFYFKGEAFAPTLELDLDDVMTSYGKLPDLHQCLAQVSNIDSYSYEFEMLIAEPIIFSNAQGLAVEFAHDGQFDLTGFEQQWHEQQQLARLAPVIKQQLEIDDINQHPALKKVILTAYHYGKESN